MKKTKGITLIALVITILVLLVLAGITINLTIGQNGIITRAQEAAKNYVAAQEKEQEGLNEFADALNDILDDTKSYDETMLQLQLGDYVMYDSGANGMILCRVLYPNEYGNGIQIMTQNTVKELAVHDGSSWENARKAHNSAIEKLNKEAEAYRNPTYAKEARSVGSDPKNKNAENKETFKLNGYTLPDGWTSNDTGLKGRDENYDTDVTMMREVDMLVSDKTYWLASRSYYETPQQYQPGIRMVDTATNFTGNIEINDRGAVMVFATNSFGLRPCFTLNKNVTIVGGDGKSQATAYQLGVK